MCFMFNMEDLTPTMKTTQFYWGLELQCLDKVYVRKLKLGFHKKIAKIMGSKVEAIDQHLKQKWDFLIQPWSFF